jgi:hypothetical protein
MPPIIIPTAIEGVVQKVSWGMILPEVGILLDTDDPSHDPGRSLALPAA